MMMMMLCTGTTNCFLKLLKCLKHMTGPTFEPKLKKDKINELMATVAEY